MKNPATLLVHTNVWLGETQAYPVQIMGMNLFKIVPIIRIYIAQVFQIGNRDLSNKPLSFTSFKN